MVADVRRMVVFGAGASGREIAWLARTIWTGIEVQFVVDDRAFLTPPVDGHGVRLVQDVTAGPSDGYVCAVGDGLTRRQGVAACEAIGLRPVSLVHPSVLMGGDITVGAGTVIYPGVVPTIGITLGRHVQVNAASSLAHDVQVGNFVTVAPGVTISGKVVIAEDATIGAGATIINGSPGEPLTIGRGAVVPAGACVTRHVEAGTMVAGIPAVRKR